MEYYHGLGFRNSKSIEKAVTPCSYLSVKNESDRLPAAVYKISLMDISLIEKVFHHEFKLQQMESGFMPVIG